jgi:Druantia protein DruA
MLSAFSMRVEIKYRGKTVTAKDIDFIKRLIADNPNDSRRALSVKLCREWNWVQANGVYRDMVCRGLMLLLHRSGHIELPARKLKPNNPFVNRKKPVEIEIDQSPINTSLAGLGPLVMRQVRNTQDETIFNGLIECHHYLGYCHPVGEHLKYIVYTDKRPIACFAWSSAPRHIGCRDRFIGWRQQHRGRHLHFMAYNTRFLILPWVRVKHLASHLLGRMVRVLSRDWERVYHHPILFLETFVDTERFNGTCYKAANWQFLGYTTGRGKNDRSKKQNRSIKAVWGYPLVRDFRERMTAKVGA